MDIQCEAFLYLTRAFYDLKNLCQLKYYILHTIYF